MNKLNMTGVLLSGGTSKRMGQDKASFVFNGQPLMDYSLALLKATSDKQIIVSKDLRHQRENIMMIGDIIEDSGPLGGIYSALEHIEEDYALVLPCDTPQIVEDVIRQLIADISDHSIIIAKYRDRIHPTIGIYKRSIRKELGDFLKKGNRKMMDFIESQNYTTVDFSSMDEKTFSNINSAQDIV